MPTATRLVLTFALLLSVLGIVTQRRASQPLDLRVEAWDLLGLCQELFSTEERAARLERDLAMLLEHSRIKDRIIQQVLQGRLTLRQAAARFLELDEQGPWANLLGVPGRSREEKACAKVLLWVRAALAAGSASGSQDLVRRLERELEDRQEGIGTKNEATKG